MQTIAPPSTVVNSLFRRLVGKDPERRQRHGKSQDEETAREDEDASVLVDTATEDAFGDGEEHRAPQPAGPSYADVGHRVLDHVAPVAIRSDHAWTAAVEDEGAADAEPAGAEVGDDPAMLLVSDSNPAVGSGSAEAPDLAEHIAQPAAPESGEAAATAVATGEEPLTLYDVVDEQEPGPTASPVPAANPYGAAPPAPSCGSKTDLAT
ncbi:MAG: hypothetical protein C0606_15100 [Hyphomicrobiales bacterium]|mgnify:CR=1 FL=1|nr:MAG: hypothetical protein C0606_15100 [Hyphomicrobiales bacterium]